MRRGDAVPGAFAVRGKSLQYEEINAAQYEEMV